MFFPWKETTSMNKMEEVMGEKNKEGSGTINTWLEIRENWRH